MPIHFPAVKTVPKAWGSETWVINNDKYCSKILEFFEGQSFSNHYHWKKEETWYILEGKLNLKYYDLSKAEIIFKRLDVGDVIHIPPGNPHQLTALTYAKILETSTHHEDEDSYRIEKGASQK